MNKKNYLVGLYILILPVLLFLDTANLRQINNKTIIFILISILIIFFLILILIKIYSLVFKAKVNDNIFPGLCFVFYLQFYYSEIKQVYGYNFWHINEGNSEFGLNLPNPGYIILILLILLSILTVILWSKYSKILNRFSIIFSVLVTLIFIYNFYIYTITGTDNKIISIETNNKSNNTNNNKSFNNIYYIIFDAMMPLEDFAKVATHSKKYENFNSNNIINKFDKNFKYIKGSVSNYNNTKVSMSSIFTNNYYLDNKSFKFKTYNNFYPYFLYDQKKMNQLDLIKLLKKNKIDFILFSNHDYPCKNVVGIVCGSSSNIETNIINEIKIFYAKTPIITTLNKLTSSLEKNIPSDDLLKYIKNNKKKNSFFFIHNKIPNMSPGQYNTECIITGKIYTYAETYHCAIKKIIEITHAISKYDKDALVLITADHGAHSSFLTSSDKLYDNTIMNHLETSTYYYDPRIFTLIKFPKKCFNTAPENFDTLNIIRFLLNCNYSEKLNYLPYYFYRTYSEDSKNFGKLVDGTKDVKKYLNKLKQIN